MRFLYRAPITNKSRSGCAWHPCGSMWHVARRVRNATTPRHAPPLHASTSDRSNALMFCLNFREGVILIRTGNWVYITRRLKE